MAPSLFGLFRDWSVDSAMTKYLARHRSENRTKEVRSVLALGLISESILGITLTN